jgi:hypothetical protein
MGHERQLTSVASGMGISAKHAHGSLVGPYHVLRRCLETTRRFLNA